MAKTFLNGSDKMNYKEEEKLLKKRLESLNVKKIADEKKIPVVSLPPPSPIKQSPLPLFFINHHQKLVAPSPFLDVPPLPINKISSLNQPEFSQHFSKKGPSKSIIERSTYLINRLKKEVSKVVVGQESIVDGLIRGLICDGHVLLEGIPGIAKTLTIRALGKASGCIINRVQFTVDLLPSDIIGITSYTPGHGFEVIKGPLFTNYLIADEINRSPPKTQSALIEAMQEKQVTIGKTRYPLPLPFFVMATKNPIENLGVYPLPEAQVDRFLFNLRMDYPQEDEERAILEKNITLEQFDNFDLQPAISPKDIIAIQDVVKSIYISEKAKSYILAIVKKTRDKQFSLADCVSYGVSPRGSISLFIASKARALMKGRNYVLPEDIKEVVFDVLRHRIILSYKATVRKISTDDIITLIMKEVKV